MKLTKQKKEQFIQNIMNDFKFSKDFHEEAMDIVKKYAETNFVCLEYIFLQENYPQLETRREGYINVGCYGGKSVSFYLKGTFKSSYYKLEVDFSVEVKEKLIFIEKKYQEERLKKLKLQEKLENNLYFINTLKQLKNQMPEFLTYIPQSWEHEEIKNQLVQTESLGKEFKEAGFSKVICIGGE